MSLHGDNPLIVGGDFIGLPKKPGDLGLANLSSQSQVGLTELEFEHTRGQNVEFGEETGFIGVGKLPGDLGRADLLDTRNREILTRNQRRSPNERASVTARRNSIAAFVGLGQSELTLLESEFADVIDPKAAAKRQRAEDKEAGISPGIRNLNRLFGGPQTSQVFSSIEDFRLDAGQQARFDAMVASGDIDADSLFRGSVPGGGGILGSFLGQFQSGGRVPGLSGLTTEQAINIIIDPNSAAPSQFDPTTGLAFAEGDIARSNKFLRDFLVQQGLPSLNYQFFPKRTNLTLRQLPLAEQKRSGERLVGNETGLRSRVTIEELTLIAELVSGRARSTNNPRDLGAASFDNTLLGGNQFLL